MDFAKDLLRFMWERKKFWLFPVVLMLVIFSALFVLAQGSVVAPFIHLHAILAGYGKGRLASRLFTGNVPLMTAAGAGAASQQSLGTLVFGGMLASTLSYRHIAIRLNTAKQVISNASPMRSPGPIHSRLAIPSRPAATILGMLPGISMPPLINRLSIAARC